MKKIAFYVMHFQVVLMLGEKNYIKNGVVLKTSRFAINLTLCGKSSEVEFSEYENFEKKLLAGAQRTFIYEGNYLSFRAFTRLVFLIMHTNST